MRTEAQGPQTSGFSFSCTFRDFLIFPTVRVGD
jgi:hypothetical protein